jgi:hypothetical protein
VDVDRRFVFVPRDSKHGVNRSENWFDWPELSGPPRAVKLGRTIFAISGAFSGLVPTPSA